MREAYSDIRDEDGVLFVIYTKNNQDAYSNEEAAEILKKEEYMDGYKGNFWSGEHPNFSKEHSRPFLAVIDLQTGVTLKAAHARPLDADEIMEAVKEAAED